MHKLLATLAAAFLVPLAGTSAPRKDAPGEALYFPTAVGTRWVYQTKDAGYEEAITEAKPDGAATVVTVVRTRDGKEVSKSRLRVSPDGLDMLASGGVTYEKPFPYLRARARPGDEWEYEFDRGGLTFRQHLKLVGPETVETPAGKFLALRADGVQRVLKAGKAVADMSTESKSWYAPGVGLVRRVMGGRETTLNKFEPGR